MFGRFTILKQWLDGNKNGVSFFALLERIFGLPYVRKAKKVIKSLNIRENDIEIYFNNFEKPFYYPKNASLKMLYQVIAELFYPNDWHYYEVDETKVSKEDIVVDCGAAEGLFGMLIADRCKRVYAIEPLPEFIESMRLSFKNIDNIVLLPVAVSNKTGEGVISNNGIFSSITLSKDNKNNLSNRISISTIDSLFFEKEIDVNYLKADLEGFELQMLEGAVRTIEKNRPKIAITTYHKKEDAEMISSFLLKINPGYKILTKGIEEKWGKPVMLHAWSD
ncbi:hypothetical protein A2230_08190 [candidate division WOR-1 bacterium RIFOXYA2_FULL_36_21]|uniref:Methyltransferase FkbM domain-containing protein n=1 Tax=candidate division WOR-1 bacterium RIFOXYB2_FULL_36_35 TaxID=1802578 RepID=A0A1F4S857_UNCSA|nr:MAG: hypothetical protein A2230_08190 [candidate division WOR-1 bacterium RIFOXYA2_FULL_36_21]OGC14620.1 MAG: hypothetical protein A2282_04205 [candidate division WOR-1 bacterium RIFOXYA12_FULL_36_13]OGC16635.1 MAG: hypothetical protein A2290_03405 [candidate division WOR-1 bacterium RIFOXYB2_FULL_36_35]